MKSTSPFETPFTLSDADRQSMQRLVKHCVDETLLDYEHVLASKSGQPNITRWRPVKRKSNVVIFQDRLAIEESRHRRRKARSLGDIVDSTRIGDLLSRRGGPRVSHSVTTGYGETEAKAFEMPKMIWMGTVECDLDDVMYGLVSQNDEVARINSSYSGNEILDFATLASLESSTPSNPFHGLQLKWEVNSALTKAKPVWHNRDFVYLEATGLTTSGATGQRIGYQILHSLDIRGAPELSECKLIRGKVAIYQLFRQKSKGTIEVFAKAMVDLAGTVPSSLGSFATIEAANSVNYAAKCVRKRKLNWLLTTTEVSAVNPEADRDESCCSLCTRQIRTAFTRKLLQCHICTNRIATDVMCGKDSVSLRRTTIRSS